MSWSITDKDIRSRKNVEQKYDGTVFITDAGTYQILGYSFSSSWRQNLAELLHWLYRHCIVKGSSLQLQ